MKEKATPFSFDNSKCLKSKGKLMIILNPKNCNTYFTEILKKYESLINLPYMQCPACSSAELIKWGSYERNLNYIDNNVVIYKVIKIRRVRCKNCGHTHAILPSCIVPYKISNLELILNGISDHYSTINFSIDTITNWKNIFNKFIPYLKTLFHNIPKSQIIDKLIQHIYFYYNKFFFINKKILMMIHSDIVNMAYF